MRKLRWSKAMRHDAYVLAYEEIAKGNTLGMCMILEQVDFDSLGYFEFYSTMLEEVFKELWLFRPHKAMSYWFNFDEEGQNERLTVLAFCIAMTE